MKNDDSTDQISAGKWSKSVSGRVVDPTVSLPGSIKRVGGNANIETVKSSSKDKKEAAKRFKIYAAALAANHGDQVRSLAAAYGISEDEAEKNQIELHTKLVSANSGSTILQVLKSNDLDRNARAMVLRDHMYGPNPAASLAALKILGDMDASSRNMEDSWESFVRDALALKKGKSG